MDNNELNKSLWDKVLTTIDLDSIEKGAYGLNRYTNDPSYRPELTTYNRNGKITRGIVYKKATDLSKKKKAMADQEEIEKELHKKDSKGKRVKLKYKDQKGNNHETDDAEIHDHDDDHVHVKLNTSLKDKDGNKVHGKNKIVKIPKTSNKRWLSDGGETHISKYEDKVHHNLVEEDRRKVKKEEKDKDE